MRWKVPSLQLSKPDAGGDAHQYLLVRFLDERCPQLVQHLRHDVGLHCENNYVALGHEGRVTMSCLATHSETICYELYKWRLNVTHIVKVRH